MATTECTTQITLFEVGTQDVTVDFEGGQVVTDAGLLAVRKLDLELGVIAGAAALMPDPRCQERVVHSRERLLVQRVYQMLAGYFDGNDASFLRRDPLFQTLADVSPSVERPLASGSTSNRFLHAYTRRDAELPLEERPALLEVRRAQLERITRMNEYLVDLFIRTRRQKPERIVIDLDPTDDPAHGQQQLTFWHGYYDQRQYFPLLVFDADSRMPLGAWLRPGTVGTNCGTAVEALREIVARLRSAWPDVPILVRGDHGVSGPEMYEFCEEDDLSYAIGYAINEVLKRRTRDDLHRVEVCAWAYAQPWREFRVFDDYKAESWSRPRRIIAKLETTATGGTNRRFIVTNLTDDARAVYEDFYCQRGDVPERPISELKNGLGMDRLSSPRFFANAQKMLYHVLAYALWVLFREANANVPEIATLEVQTARPRLFKAGAVVKTSMRRIWFHFSSTWPTRETFRRACEGAARFAAEVRTAVETLTFSPAGADPPVTHPAPLL
ncbi:MAG: IS1380 family transposase [Planctomycetes bacterium]|nr:IS1380 family transposase [Planctomycetota bacterium]